MKDNANADFFLRLPLTEQSTMETNSVSSTGMFYEQQLETLLATADVVRQLTCTDVELSKVYHFVLSGWPKSTPPSLHAFNSGRNEITS